MRFAFSLTIFLTLSNLVQAQTSIGYPRIPAAPDVQLDFEFEFTAEGILVTSISESSETAKWLQVGDVLTKLSVKHRHQRWIGHEYRVYLQRSIYLLTKEDSWTSASREISQEGSAAVRVERPGDASFFVWLSFDAIDPENSNSDEKHRVAANFDIVENPSEAAELFQRKSRPGRFADPRFRERIKNRGFKVSKGVGAPLFQKKAVVENGQDNESEK